MPRDSTMLVRDILRALAKIQRYTAGMNQAAFLSDELTYDAVVRNLAIIGEAAKHIPENMRQQHPQIDWRRIAGMRDIVSHHYFSIYDEIVWDVVMKKIPELQEQIQALLE